MVLAVKGISYTRYIEVRRAAWTLDQKGDGGQYGRD